MKSKVILDGIKAVAGVAAQAAPGIIDHYKEKKEEKSFFDNNKNWILLIILSIFVVNVSYFELFDNAIIDSVINLVYGLIMCVLLGLFIKEQKTFEKVNSKFIDFITILVIMLGIFNSLYHIGFAIYNLL